MEKIILRQRNSSARPRSNVGGSASVERALTLLRAFQMGDRYLTLAELAVRTGFYKSSILRLLKSLHAHGFIVISASVGYKLGPAAFYLGSIYRASLDLGDIVPSRLQVIVDQTSETASFYVRHDINRACLYRIKPPTRLTDNIVPGVPLPLDETASSLILKRYDPELDQAAAHKRVEVATVTEHAGELAGLAVPVFGAGHGGSELVGALALSGPKSRFNREALTRYKTLLLQEAACISSYLGGNLGRFPPES
jgi:DNA-binding IclR family transcriptional regulator